MKADLIEVAQAPEPTPAQPEAGMALMIERLAANPNVDVDKLRQILDMQERVLNRDAETAFNIAFNEMQPEIPIIAETARTDKTKYAPFEEIIKVIRPIYSKHGFSLSFQTQWPSEKTVKVIGILTHKQGHSRTSEFVSLADQTGSKNAIQALASTISYGKRYTTNDLFCIATRDDDGQASGKASAPDAPAGYDDWLDDLTAVADHGEAALRSAWDKSKPIYRNYITKYDAATWAGLKAKALKVQG